MFFLSMTRKEIADVLREDGRAAPVREYAKIVKGLKKSINLYIYREKFPDFELASNSTQLRFNQLLRWSDKDWSKLYKRLKDDWIIVWVARGAFVLIDALENHLDDYPWTYIKPETELKPHEDSSIFEEYTDPALDDKLSEFKGQELKVLYIEDIILDDYESNVDHVQEFFTQKCEEHDIEIVDRAVIALLTRTTTVSGMPVYGTLLSYNGGIATDWGNDRADRFDETDFSENKEYIDDL